MSMDTLLIMPVVMLARNIDFENEQNMLMARIVFGVSQLLVVIAYFLLKSKIAAFKGDKKIRVKKEPSLGNPAPEEGEMEEITEKEHDERELKKMLNQSIMQLVQNYRQAAEEPKTKKEKKKEKKEDKDD